LAFLINEISKAMTFKILKLKVVHYVFPFSPKCSKIAICGLLETNYVFRVTASVTQLFTFSRRFREKFMRSTGQGGRLKTICPEIFFDFQTGGCKVNPYKVSLWHLKL